jgi:xylan 1,4-beta-xylosidase
MKRAFASFFALVFLALSFVPNPGQAQVPAANEIVEIDAQASTQPFPHYWEQMFGSGRAILSLRNSYRQDLRDVKRATGFTYIRFHAIFHDEVGVYSEDADGHPVYNFSYVDQIYDGLLANNVKPFVELSFMPKQLSSNPAALHAFWYKQNVAPPKDWGRWGDLVYQFTKHLVEHYGEAEVEQWYFEVWNEPNIDFWVGDPKEATYYELYDHAARAIKRVSPKLRVGGPATAQAAWVGRFIQHCRDNKVPFDFVSTHVYGNDSAPHVFGTDEKIPRTKFVCRAAHKVFDEVKASPTPDIPIIWSEYNASYFNEPDVTDAAFMGPWLADTIRQCDGLATMMSYWDFSDVFEEQGVIQKPFYGGFGLMAEGSVPKPAYNAFAMLHQLGDRRIPAESDSVLATRRVDGTIVLAAWNLFLPEEAGHSKEMTLALKGLKGEHRAFIQNVDAERGSPLPAYGNMGSPITPTAAQYRELREAARLPDPKSVPLQDGKVSFTLPPHSLFVIEIR